MSERSSRTEKPTARRLDDARKKGQVPRTQDLSSALGLGAFLLFAHLFGGDWLDQVQRVMAAALTQPMGRELTASEWFHIVSALVSSVITLLFLPVGMLACAGITGSLLQGKPPLSLTPLKPDLNRLSPIEGLKRIFRLKALIDLLKAAIKVTMIAAIAYITVRGAIAGRIPGTPGVEGTLLAIFTMSGKVILRVAILLLVLAIIDLLYTRWDFKRGMRMTKQEVKEERKQVEGDPRVKSRIRSKQLATARARMMAEVPTASVVITNPTHFAVALRYDPATMDVPLVVAKGRNLTALRIREVARKNNVPVVQDPPLARALYDAVRIGDAIPVALFRAVAEVLALVFRGRNPRSGPRPEARR